jgi:hypothetical protein
VEGAIAVLKIGGMNDNVRQETERVDQDVPLATLDLLARVVPRRIKPMFRLARFQSPTLQAIPVAQQQSSTTSEPIHYEVHIHNARGDHIKTTIDGEVVEEPDMKLIESDRSDGPDA